MKAGTLEVQYAEKLRGGRHGKLLKGGPGVALSWPWRLFHPVPHWAPLPAGSNMSSCRVLI